MALTLMLVSGLMVRTFAALRQVDPGFTGPEEVQTFRVATPPGLVSDPAEVARTHELITDRLTRVPGVTAAGPATSITLDGEDNGNWVEVEGDARATTRHLRRFKGFGPGFFETLGIRLVAGRSITWTEVHNRHPIIVVSEAFAREYWQNPADAIGKRLRASSDVPWREIVGVVGNERDDGLNKAATAIVYWPLLNDSYDRESMAYAVRSTRIGTTVFMRELHEAVWSVNPKLPLSDVQTLEEILERSMAQTSFATVMLVIAASVALLLGIVGIYGVIAYVAMQRTREIGIRIALGAQLRDVSGMFLRHGALLTATGVALGVVAALAFTRLMAALLFGVGPNDPITYAAVSALLAVVALLAVYLPARRASRVDPVIALRTDA